MKKKRPTALDRELANIFRKMDVGSYTITVEPLSANLGLALLKHEGSISFQLDGAYYLIIRTNKEQT